MSVELKLIWKPDTPGSEPAGARISAGKSGSVLMSLPKTAAVRVNWVPVSCMPSPESPAKRIVTRSSSWIASSGSAGGRHAPSGLLHPLVRPRRQVEELLGERLGEVLDDVDLADDADEMAVVVDDRHVAVAAGLHELDRVADRLVEVERLRFARHQRLDRLGEVDVADHDPARRCRAPSGRRGADRTRRNEHRIASAGALDRPEALGKARARWRR